MGHWCWLRSGNSVPFLPGGPTLLNQRRYGWWVQLIFRPNQPLTSTVLLGLSGLTMWWSNSAEAEFIFRAGIMYMSSDVDNGEQQLRSNMFSLSGTGFFGAVGRSINLGGQTALALRLLLALFSSKLSSDLNRPFGDEFRAARKASEEVGAQIVLGDRPIEITLERAWKSLNWSEKVNLVLSVIRGITAPLSDISGNDLKEQSNGDDTFQLYERLSFSYPSLLQPLVHERDTYLAWSLKRSKAVNKCKTVVGVIGKGHMNGVIYALVSDQGDLRFRDLAGKTPSEAESGWVQDLFKSLVRDTLIGILLWALYQQIQAGSLWHTNFFSLS
ncbi:traB domain-containing protein-like isoform X2 [Hibiscus syriacus]|uniref:traB domain-containing protein-like isoform X2 n=1 Tax=Hibiscus syriacus TaxID=106335 RepID=UPI001922875A|nr:traB domain-containing protein-like isoform X2 [Hibiscus syriacus]